MMSHDDIENRYLDKNQTHFFENLFCCSTRENGAIAQEVIRLCGLLDPVYKTHFVEEEVLTEKARTYLCDSPAQLAEVYESLKEKNLLTTYNTASFMAVGITRVSYNLKLYDQYKALSLLVVTHLSFQGSHDSKINRLCNELRQYALGKRERLAAYLPDILREDFPSLISTLEILEQSDELQTSNVRRQINNIKVPYRDSYENKKGYSRNIKSREFRRDSQLNIAEKQPIDDDKSVSIIEVKELAFSTRQNKNMHWAEEEEQSSQSRTMSVVTSREYASKDYATQGLQARAMNERIRKKSMMLSCDITRTTAQELRHLVADCIAALKEGSERKECARVLLLMLITGNTLAEITKWKAYRNAKKRIIGIKRVFKLPSQALRKELHPLMKNVSNEYHLPLPLNLVSDLKSFTFKELDEKTLTEFISEIKKRHGIKLTINKITSYLPQTLRSSDIDCTLIDLITGHGPKNEPARYYTYIPYSLLLQTVKRFISHINSAGNCDYLIDLETHQHEDHKTTSLGSPLYVEPAILQSLFTKLRAQINERKKANSKTYSEYSHNLNVLYLQLVLGIISGYRPVEGWFGTVDDIHFSTGEYRIAEKERGVGYSGRIVILPQLVLSLLKGYLDYCERAAIFFSTSEPELSRRYVQAIDGELSFCFYRYQEKTQEVSPSSYMQHIDPIFPLPANWTRHYLRSFLFSQGVSDELIGAWMGHIHSNQLPFAQFSQLNRHNLQDIATLLEAHLTTLLSGENQ